MGGLKYPFGQEKENKEKQYTTGTIIFMVIAVIARLVALFFTGSALVYVTWNYVIAKTIAFATPMTSFWQAALLMLLIEIVAFVCFFRLSLMFGRNNR